MMDVVLWLGRLAVLGALLLYVARVAAQLRRGVGVPADQASAWGEPPWSSSPQLILVQDNSAEGVTESGDGRRLAVQEGVALGTELTLGRDPENGMVIGDRFASGRHARLFRRDEEYWVEDLNSRNGTLLNGHRVTGPRRVVSGDRITVGSCTFRFVG